jgi:hypothetical protein
MEWQQIISFLIVGLSIFLIAKSEIKKHRIKKIIPCAGNCNCAAKKIILLKQSKRNQ